MTAATFTAARAVRSPVGPAVVLAGAFLALVCAAALAPDLFASAPDRVDPAYALRPPGADHLFGTDQLGRDVFARVVHGARASLLVGLGSTALAALAGSAWGLLAALGGRVADEVCMRLADVFLSFPSVLMALLVVAVLGPGTRNVTIAITIALAPGFARVVRVRGAVVRDAPYVRAAVNLGVPPWRILARHVAPNVLAPLLILATMNVGAAITAGASLSFLGLGPQPPEAEWGAMLAQSRDYFDASWTLAVFPGAAVTLTVMSVTIVGRALQARYEGREAR
ncbi:peptide/nickel transport system permease protein [Thermocatellispora tengchongensis]|uniref:Peptide/nickel transport system permease protein n=1 Tax=Thermocatellispora tengchongensis TaxID=1073253 RepID=A0A840PJ06_9ACTN|nr:ABC transporter permease [Thermocatellispora tengchongensis]MBB5138866.1 peptide/nickel transport system permease protein [Thermocatellispora tengchongensis]